MEIDVGANLACRYFSAKNSNAAGKWGNTVDASSPPNRNQRLIIKETQNSDTSYKILGIEPKKK